MQQHLNVKYKYTTLIKLIGKLNGLFKLTYAMEKSLIFISNY